jgi:hypothetical protein
MEVQGISQVQTFDKKKGPSELLSVSAFENFSGRLNGGQPPWNICSLHHIWVQMLHLFL